MPFNVPENHKFSCLALANAGVNRELHDPIDLGGGAWAIFESPFGLDDAWRRWLGSIRADELTRTSLALLVHQPSANPAVIDAENQALEQYTLSLLYALFLVEIFHYDSGLILGGANIAGRIDVRRVITTEEHYRPNGVRPERIDRDSLLRAAKVAAGIRAVHTPGRKPERIQRGFHAWIRGVQEYYGDMRLHQFVRAVEAMVKPEIGRSKRLFVHRCQLFAGNTEAARQLLGELYDLRSLAEHLHPLDQALKAYAENDRENTALCRAYQAQLLASSVYERIFSSADLQNLFATDAATEAFWAMLWADQVKIWGDPIDLNATAAARFTGPGRA